MTFEEWFKKFIGSIEANSGRLGGVTIATYHNVARQAWEAAQSQGQPIETAPKDGLYRLEWEE